MTGSDFPFASRLASVRAGMRDLGLDALVVTHAPNLFYLSGFTGSTGALVVDGDGVSLLVDFRYITAAQDLPRKHDDLSQLAIVRSERSEDETLLQVLSSRRRKRIGIEAAWMPVLRFNRLSSALAREAPTPLAANQPCPVLVATERLVERVRLVKDAMEVRVLRDAAARLSRVATDALRGIVTAGRTEVDVAASIDAALRDAGFQRPAFETIVASGPHSALPHARPTSRMLADGDPVVLDFGGVYDGYCVDLTRTVQLAPSTEAFRRLFASVMEAQAAAIGAVRPGTLTTDIDLAARTALDRRGLAEAFGHGTGHGLGLEVHEEPRISRADPARPAMAVSAGMVFTIEPGVYLPGIGGVRIEDDVLVVEDGCEVLTRVPTALW
jgi:Xaa-Pro aminopeptidase